MSTTGTFLRVGAIVATLTTSCVAFESNQSTITSASEGWQYYCSDGVQFTRYPISKGHTTVYDQWGNRYFSINVSEDYNDPSNIFIMVEVVDENQSYERFEESFPSNNSFERTLEKNIDTKVVYNPEEDSIHIVINMDTGQPCLVPGYRL